MAYAASLHGSDGSCTLATDYDDLVAGTDIHIYEWHATFTRDLIEDSGFDQATNWKQNVGGMYDLKGTAIATQMVGRNSPMGADVGNVVGFEDQNATVSANDFTLQTVTGDTYTFKGIISSIRTVTRKTDRVIVTIAFESHGEVTVNG